MDNAGGSQVLGSVIDSVSSYLSTTNVQLGAPYSVARQSTHKYTEGVAAAAKYVNAAPHEVVLGASTTQLLRNLSIALNFPPESEIICSRLDHEANIAPWVQIAEWKNLTLKWWQPQTSSTNPKLDPQELKRLLTPKTRLVTCTHTSNLLGTISPIRAIADAVHTIPGAMLCVDAVAYAPHRPVDVKAFGADYYCFSWYKVYGPHISMLYASEAAQREMVSLGHYFKGHDALEDKLALAGANYESVQCIPHIVRYLEEQNWQAMKAHEAKLQDIILGFLRHKEEVTIFGEPSSDPELRVPTISFRVNGWQPEAFVDAVLAQSNFGFRSGHMYSKRLVNDVFGIPGDDGLIRVSLVHYNTEDEVRGLVDVFKKVLAEQPGSTR